MKRKTLLPVIICLVGAMSLAGCGASSGAVTADKPETVEADSEITEELEEETEASDGQDNQKALKEKKQKEEKASEEAVTITEVSWNHGSPEEFNDNNSEVTEVYFTLSNGDTITKQIPLGTYVEGKDEIDIDGDGEDEIVINQYFANNVTEYSVVSIFKLVNGSVEEIFPVDDIPGLTEDVADTVIKPLDKEGFPKYMLDVTTYQKDGADVSVKYHALLAWNKDTWEAIETDDESDNNDTADASFEQEPFFGVWLDAFKDRSDAEALAEKLEDKGLPASCVYSCEWENLNKDPYFCVTIGKSGSEPEAQAYIEDARKAGYPKAYVKYTGERLGHRVYYYLTSEGENVEAAADKVILHDVSCENVGDEDDEGPMDLVIDADTVFDESCDTSFFDGYQQGDTPLEWIHHARELEDKEPDRGPLLLGVYEVSLTGGHVDRYYGAYWWD